MSRKYFGTDGIRGLVGKYPVTADFALKLGHAVGRVLIAEFSHTPTVVIGKDTRISGYMLESALEAGLVSAGVNVGLTGPLPTPGVAHLVRALRADLGVVISASHNSYEDNGIKFFSAIGEKLPDSWEIAVEKMLEEEPQWVHSLSLGKAKRIFDAEGRYIEFCKSTVAKDFTLRGLNLVIDAAHGAAYHVAPSIFHELGANVTSIGVTPDGLNINKDVGATSPQALVKKVLETNADYGIALDGDADRLQVVDSQGTLFNGDQLLYILADSLTRRGITVPGVVGTLMTNQGIENALKAKGIELVRAKVGDRYIVEELNKRKWTLGAEGSGHILVLDKHSTGDGIVSALQVLQAVTTSGYSLKELLQDTKLYHQELINVKTASKANAEQLNTINEKALLHTKDLNGRILIRPSGTEPVIRVMVEALDSKVAKNVAQALAQVVQEVIGG